MSHKLKGNTLAYVATHLVRCRKHASKRCRAVIVADDRESWNKLQQKLTSIYTDASIKDDSGKDCDFSLVFDNSGRRDEVVADINGAVGEYLEAHPEVDNPDYEPDPDPTPAPTTDTIVGEGEDEETETKTDYTTYIIIGAAAAIVIALLVWKK